MLKTTKLIEPFEEICRKQSEEFYLATDEEFRAATKAFDELLHQYYLFTCCHWGCHGKEHVFEHLGGRAVSHIASANGLILRGYYDEAMSLIRSVGEIANLLNLFWASNATVREWLDGSERDRRRNFAPAEVRKRLSQLGKLVPFDDAHYKRLCESVVHPTPKTAPNAHRDPKQPVLGALFQSEGFLTAFWELYWALTMVAGPSAKIAIMPEPEAVRMVELTIPLFELVEGKITK